MLQMEALRKVLSEKGIDFEEVLQEVQREQAILSYLRQVGQGAASLLPEGGWLTLDITVEEDKILVTIVNGTLSSRTVEIDRRSQKESGSTGQRTRDGKGSQVVSLLESACSRYGVSLKEWQKRSIAFHAPQVFRSLLKETKNAIAEDPDFKAAIEAYRQWHPERSAELPQVD